MTLPRANDMPNYMLGDKQVTALWLNGVKIWPSGDCPTLLSIDELEFEFFGSSTSEVYRTTATYGLERRVFPTQDYIETIISDWNTDIVLPAPFDTGNASLLLGFADIACGPDGYTYALFYDNFGFGDWGVVKFPSDDPASDFQVLYTTATTGPLWGNLSWHPADPDNVWCSVMSVDSGTHDLFTIDRVTGTRTDILDLEPIFGATGTTVWSVHQYANGLVMRGHQPPFTQFLAYDIASGTYAVQALPTGGFTLGVTQAGLVFLRDDSGDHGYLISGSPVSIAPAALPCDAPFYVDEDYGTRTPYIWMAPLDRSGTYLTGDLTWQLE